MGLSAVDAHWVLKAAPVKKGKMLELGAQYMSGGFAQEYFEMEGWEVVSLDWNGKGRSRKVDLAEPFNLGLFDVVTNFGTTEHVSNQRVVFKNIHDACRMGGVMIHKVPGVHPSHLNHGTKYGWVLRYSDRFFKELAEDNGYEVISWERPDWLICCVLRRENNHEFNWRN